MSADLLALPGLTVPTTQFYRDQLVVAHGQPGIFLGLVTEVDGEPMARLSSLNGGAGFRYVRIGDVRAFTLRETADP